MKNLKGFVGKFCSEWMVKQAVAMQLADQQALLGGGGAETEKQPDSAATDGETPASEKGKGPASSAVEELAGGKEGQDYLAGLGAKFKYPGDPKRCVAFALLSGRNYC